MLLHVDCNNFYVSCERVFDPKLEGRPVVVLSNNDACVISRSNEAKALGIPMGAPMYKHRTQFKRDGVVVRSSNYTLYADMSRRCMETMSQFATRMECYSIDEAFLETPNMDAAARMELGQRIRATIKQWTGLPVSVGIGPTKVLAKLANKLSKKSANVFDLVEHPNLTDLLKEILTGKIWGIGWRHAEKLAAHNILTAHDLIQASEPWIKQHLTIVGLRIVKELKGEPCLPLITEAPPRRAIACSRMFGHEVTAFADLHAAMTVYLSRAAERLRAQHSTAQLVQVYLTTNRFKAAVYTRTAEARLPEATDQTPQLLHHAEPALRSIYRPGLAYNKIGVLLAELGSRATHQTDLFSENLPSANPKRERLMSIADELNAHWGDQTLRYAPAGTMQPWAMKRELLSHGYTTDWSGLLAV